MSASKRPLAADPTAAAHGDADRPAPPVLPADAALFLDFDGTLAPIAQRPQDVRVPSWLVPLLRRLHARLGGALALVSGRPLAAIDALLRPLRLPAAGVHGVERRLADGRIRIHGGELPSALLAAAKAWAAAREGALIEVKPAAVALHYRSRPELEASALQLLRDALPANRAWEVLRGNMVAEFKPRQVSKSTVVAAYLAEPTFAGRVPVFVGDDISDEDGFRAAQAVGGFGVKVGAGASAAQFRLPGPAAVGRWLRTSADLLDRQHGAPPC